ncbi:hypothetical protein [Borreliella turdi]|uniref:hypothetical protein n=1 Tax=Borreliella turdi TaxID=57863 RepID=UPI003AEF9EBD
MNGKTDKINDFNEIWEKRFKKTSLLSLSKSLRGNYQNDYVKSKENICNHNQGINISFFNNKGFKKNK